MMKRVNFDPDIGKRKSKIMEQFDQGNGPEDQASGDDNAINADEAEALTEEQLKERVIDALKTIYDPEIPVNIYDLGLIYRVDIKGSFAEVDMTLTTPGCPVAHSFPGLVERSVTLVPGIDSAAVELVWDPPWSQANISEAARLELGLI